ncbi:hypothetical protein [Lonepinella koalarum]|uniref:hypothetical protein n=1 Tax=Lonepinella koalarum TaxID=53417 RepID=UPI003F6DCB7D
MNDCYLSFKNIDDDNEERFNQYYIPGTKVLRNFLNITNSKKLRAYEQRLVLLNYAKAINVNKTYDFEHIIAIHQALFGNIYPFAGELRQANMGKTIQGEVYIIKVIKIQCSLTTQNCLITSLISIIISNQKIIFQVLKINWFLLKSYVMFICLLMIFTLLERGMAKHKMSLYVS